MAVSKSPIFIIEAGDISTYVDGGLLDHKFFDRNVILLFSVEVTGEKISASSKALEVSDMAAELQRSWINKREVDRFNWGIILKNWGKEGGADGFYAVNNHPDDQINGVRSVWMFNGRAQWKKWADIFWRDLKINLTNNGINYPSLVEPNYTEDGGNLVIYGSPNNEEDQRQSFSIYSADSRFTTELIDGSQTLDQFIRNYKNLDGQYIEHSRIFPLSAGIDEFNGKNENMHTSISMLTNDYMLNETMYSPAIANFPDIMTGNRNIYTASREHPVSNFRFKDTPVDLNNNLWANTSIMSWYSGYSWLDPAILEPPYYTFYRQYYAMVDRYDINEGQSVERIWDDIFRADYEFQAIHMPKSSPGKRHAFWYSYSTYLSASGGDASKGVDIRDDYSPRGGFVFKYTTDLAEWQIRTALKNGINTFGLYEPEIASSKSADILDFWEISISNALPNAPAPTLISEGSFSASDVANIAVSSAASSDAIVESSSDLQIIERPRFDAENVARYFDGRNIEDAVLRVTYDFSIDPYAPYRNAYFGIFSSTDGKTRLFSGFFEPVTGGLIHIINIPLQGQSLSALASSINAFNIVKAEVLRNSFLLNTNCLIESPLQRATNTWSFFFGDAECDTSQQRYSNLRNDITTLLTSVQPVIAQTNTSQSLGGFASPSVLGLKSKLTKAVSFYDTVLVFDDDELSGEQSIQIGDEIINISTWQDNKAVVNSRNAFATPLRFHPEGTVAKSVKKNDVFNGVLSSDNAQYRCLAIRNQSETAIAKDMKIYFKFSARNPLSGMRFAIEIPRSDFYRGTAAKGSNTVFASHALREVFVDGHFVSAPITFESGGNAGQTRIVSAYNAQKGQITLDEPLPFNVAEGDTFSVDAAPSQVIPSAFNSPSTVSKGLEGPPYLITDFLTATSAAEGVSINVNNKRNHKGDMWPNDVIYVWFERKLDPSNEPFVNSRSVLSFSFSRI